MTYGYARASTEENGEMQIVELRQAGCAPKNIFIDHGPSGTYIKRPQLTRCLAKLLHGDQLVISKLDRLGRNTHDLFTMMDDFRQRGINLRSLNDNIDTSTPGNPFFQVTAAFSEFERSLMLERTKEGRNQAGQKGKTFGRPPTLTRQQKFAALKLLAYGDNSNRVAELFGVSRSTLYRALRGMPPLFPSQPHKGQSAASVEAAHAMRLWELVLASDPASIRSIEMILGTTQKAAVDYLIEETGWREDLPQYANGRGTPEERRRELILADHHAELAAVAAFLTHKSNPRSSGTT